MTKKTDTEKKKAKKAARIPEETKEVKLADLLLDPQNPRLPVDKQKAAQADLLRYIAEEYEPLEIGRSIALYGYFPSEPMIAMATKGKYTVLEGNRRLTALRLLAEPALAVDLELDDAEEWNDLAGSVTLPETIPVVVAKDRRSVAPIIGYRHISGIEPWDPWSKARFIAGLIDDDKLEFKDTAAEVGEAVSDVRANYRNYRIALQARDTFGISIKPVEQRFGVFTRAMQDSDLLQFISAPSSDKVKSGKEPLPDSSKNSLKELLTWLFGDDKTQPIITDSRKIRELGKVVASPSALKVLRKTGDLEEAFAAAGGLRDRLATYLDRANAFLDKAEKELPDYVDDKEIVAKVKACSISIKKMIAHIDE